MGGSVFPRATPPVPFPSPTTSLAPPPAVVPAPTETPGASPTSSPPGRRRRAPRWACRTGGLGRRPRRPSVPRMATGTALRSRTKDWRGGRGHCRGGEGPTPPPIHMLAGACPGQVAGAARRPLPPSVTPGIPSPTAARATRARRGPPRERCPGVAEARGPFRYQRISLAARGRVAVRYRGPYPSRIRPYLCPAGLTPGGAGHAGLPPPGTEPGGPAPAPARPRGHPTSRRREPRSRLRQGNLRRPERLHPGHRAR